MVMDSRHKNICEPRFSIAPLDLDDCKVTEVKYSSKLIREMKVKAKEQSRTRMNNLIWSWECYCKLGKLNSLSLNLKK